MNFGKISVRQLIWLLLIDILSTGLLYAPLDLLKRSGRDAYLTLLIIGILGIFIAWMIGTLLERYPEQTAYSMFTSIMGKTIGKIIGISYALFWFISSLTLADSGGAVIHIVFIPQTPPVLILFLLYAVAGYGAYLGLESLARFSTFVIPTMILTYLGIGALNLHFFDINHLLPFLENGISPILSGIPGPLGWIGQISILLMFSHQVQDNKRTIPLLWVVVLSTLALEYIVVLMLLVMDYKLPTFYLFPPLQLARTISLGGTIRGFDSLVMTVWVTAIIIKTSLWLYVAIKMISDILKLQNKNSLIAPLIILATILSFPGMENTYELSYYLGSVWSQFALPTFEAGIPFFLLIISYYKIKIKKNA